MNSDIDRRPDYRTEYNDYWSRDDRAGESSGDLERTADQIIASCRAGHVLDIGSGEGALVSALLRRGVDAEGVDISDVVVRRCNQRHPGRFSQGSILSLPFGDESFDSAVSTDCLEHLAPQDVPKALQEIRRVVRSCVFLKVATTQDRDQHWHLTVEGRAWWEARCFEAGFRKHPAYYRLNDYESLNHEGWQVCILLEKVPDEANTTYPLASLNEERGLHMDMLRDTGERSDAHVIRYQWACNYIKPGDRVLDAACGPGYGGRVIEHLTQADRVVGIDAGEFAIDYATKSFSCDTGNVVFRLGQLPEALSSFEDGSFDVIVSFETLEHVTQPEALLREFHRLLTPGGRIIVSVPNDWSDETGKDPNPHHLHVYDWARLKRELAGQFILEEAFSQTASQCKVRSRGNVWERRSRSLRMADLTDDSPADCEWWLMTAMKTPLGAVQEYHERAFRNIAGSGHPSIDYSGSFRNPWLMHSMVNVSYRLRNGAELERLATDAMASSANESNDHAAALCVRAYRALERRDVDAASVLEVLTHIDTIVASPPQGPMGQRWKVSLLFVKARLLQSMGRLDEARDTFEQCAKQDVRGFGIHLSSKITEAWFHAGKIANALGDSARARRCWEQGVDYATTLLSTSLDAILINRSYPNRFNYGDGVREFTVAWDNIARCANGLHLLSRGGSFDDALLENCFQTEYAVVVRALFEARLHMAELTDDLNDVRRLLSERTEHLEVAGRDLRDRTRELVETRESVVERTRRLETASEDLRHRTLELVECRKTLSDRTQLLEAAIGGLPDAARDLVDARRLLADRTERLEVASRDLHERTQELVDTRETLADRTRHLEVASEDLRHRTQDLVDTRETLAERTGLLEAARDELHHRTQDLVDTRAALAERTRLLEAARVELHRQTQNTLETRKALAERTGQFEVASDDLQHRNQDLANIRATLADRTHLLEAAKDDLHHRTQDLLATREALVDRTTRLESAHMDIADKSRALNDLREVLDGINRAPFAHAFRATFRRLFK